MTKQDQLGFWLGDAHAMEVAMITTLEKQISDARDCPNTRALLEAHLIETRSHAEALKEALASLGEKHPAVKEGVSKIVNLAANAIPSLARDTVLKNTASALAAEHMEIVCYKALVATATELGERKIAAVCRKILQQEQIMARALAAILPKLRQVCLQELEDEREGDIPKISPMPRRRSAKIKNVQI
jgi:ferritin-like metal-binding protein YciE